MQMELIQTTTSDGLHLHGAFLASEDSVARALDALLLVHGTTGSFYTALRFGAARFRDAGYAVASFNTRGHDVVSAGAPGRTGGSAYEILEECRLDLDAAITWLVDSGYHRIGLLGVSMGAVKVVYYQAQVHDPRVAAVIAVSPVRLSRSYYLASEAADEYERTYQRAKELVESGDPATLLSVKFPNATIFGAEAYLDKHGSEHYNPVHNADKVGVPLLILAGTLETHPRLLDCAQDMYNSVRDKATAELLLVEGGTHALPELGEGLADPVIQFLARPVYTPA